MYSNQRVFNILVVYIPVYSHFKLNINILMKGHKYINDAKRVLKASLKYYPLFFKALISFDASGQLFSIFLCSESTF